MNASLRTLPLLVLGLLPLGLPAQVNPRPSQPQTVPARSLVFDEPLAGRYELTLGGSGLSNSDMDNSAGGISGSFSYYLNDTLSLGIRQTANYFNPEVGGSSWAGTTRLALNHHFSRGQVRPFIGVNLGGLYGRRTNDTWLAGIEGGVKYYVQPRTFLFALVDYGWAFDRAKNIDDNFSSGGYQWSLGVGFNF